MKLRCVPGWLLLSVAFLAHAEDKLPARSRHGDVLG